MMKEQAMNNIYLHFIISPFDDLFKPKMYILDEQENFKLISLSELSVCTNRIVTHNFWMLVESFRMNDIPLPKSILDLSFLSKLIIGKPKSDFNHMKPWEIWSLLFQYYNSSSEELDYIKNIFYSKSSYIEDALHKSKMKVFLKNIKLCHNLLFQKLEEIQEKERFINIELPVFHIMLNRQYLGIKYDEEKLIKVIKDIESDYYRKLKKLNFEYGIDENNLSNNRVFELIKEKEKIDFTEYALYSNNNDYINLLTENSVLANLIVDIKRLKNDRNALLKFGSLDEDRVYPIFDTHGSVTSRIFILDPLIQYIRKSSREVISPDIGKKFIYVDYRQFEPGILASLSEDIALIEMYNSHDIYSSLSNAIFGNGDNRKICKKLFLAYSFGMTKEGMLKFLKLNTDLIDLENKVESFFGQFARIEEFKEELYLELYSNSRIASDFGNYRYRKFEGELKSEEKRWCLSQKIQGTASLILKNVILSIKNNYNEIDILIPMHDALLMQVEEDKFDIYKSKIEDIFMEEYKLICPSINPKVSFEPFF